MLRSCSLGSVGYFVAVCIVLFFSDIMGFIQGYMREMHADWLSLAFDDSDRNGLKRKYSFCARKEMVCARME